MERGKEAHKLLGIYLKAIFPNNIKTEAHLYNVYNKKGELKTGYADVMFEGFPYWEVYEIKPRTYEKGAKYQSAQRQRNSYVDALAVEGIMVNRDGQTLNPFVNGGGCKNFCVFESKSF